MRFHLLCKRLMFLCGAILVINPTLVAQPLGPQEISQFLRKLSPQPQAPGLAAVAAPIEPPRFSTTAGGDLRYVGAPPGQHFPLTAPALAGRPDAIARDFLFSNGRQFGVRSPAIDFVVKRNRPHNGRNHIRLQQSYRGLPIVAAEAVVQVNAQGGVESAITDLATDTGPLDQGAVPVVPVISTDEAGVRARAAFASQAAPAAIQITPAQLSIFAPSVLDEPGNLVLVWDLEVSCETALDANARVLVNAINGEIVRVWTLVHSALNRNIFDANTTTNNPGTLVRSEGQPTTGIADANNAYTFLGDTYNFYSTMHGRDSLDGFGMTLSATVRYCQPNGANPPFCPPQSLAFYSGNRMYFGGGYVADDVTAHELTHGVTGFESGLIYANTSGALNESFSDVWGEFVDLGNGAGNDAAGVRWDLGEDAPGGRIRSMSFPTNFSHPDRLSSALYVAPTNNPNSTNDFGGVHRNSGVNNKLCYLLTDGDTFNGQTIYGLGITRIAKLYYGVQINFVPAAGWVDLYNALRQSAVNLGWNTADRNNLYRACLAVEIITPTDGQIVWVEKTSVCPNPAGVSFCDAGYGPYVTVGQGINGSYPGGVLRVRTGSYNEPMTVTKILTIQAENGPVTIGQ